MADILVVQYQQKAGVPKTKKIALLVDLTP